MSNGTPCSTQLIFCETQLEKAHEELAALKAQGNEVAIQQQTPLDELNALKQSQGEPVYYEITLMDGTRFVAANRSILEGAKSKPLCYCAAAPKPEDVK